MPVELHLIFLSIYLGLCCCSFDRRLLLNDPDVLRNELASVHNLIAEMNKTLLQYQAQTSQQEAKIVQQAVQLSTLERQLNQTNRGSTFVTWGRKTCPMTATTVYSGYVGGGLDSDPGAAAESLCLPSDPQFTLTHISNGAGYARIYGAEYYSKDFFRPNGNDIPCSVCHTPESTTLMIPARNTCYPGWKQQYYGYLASGYYNSVAASSYICIHNHPEDLSGGEQQHAGRGFYPVLSKCAPLECPPYHNDYPLTCVVCSK